MPHRFKGARVSRSHRRSCSFRCSNPPPLHSPRSTTAPLRPPMAHSTPRTAKQIVYHFDMRNIRQANEQDMAAWRSEVDGKIVDMTSSIDEFLCVFVPSNAALPSLKARRPFNVPVGVAESRMYEPLCNGLKKLVVDFPPEKQPCFHNNAHELIKFPFEKYEHDYHATKPDVVASLPGQTFNISVVFEAKNTEKADPMGYSSKENNEALVQLAKSARNILVSQSRLFTFAVGIYGDKARIYRFDHAGAVCSPLFPYTSKGGAVLHEFLWRLVNPMHEGCDIVGADPTVRLPTQDDREQLEAELRLGGVDYDDNTWSMCRWVTVKGAAEGRYIKYLLYDLVFINPGLFSRATTQIAGKHVIIKDSWQQLARRPETEHYEQINAYIGSRLIQDYLEADDDMTEAEAFLSAWDQEWTGLAQFVAGDDLGEEELSMADRERVGQHTSSAKYQNELLHQFLERSHTRTVSRSVGTPLSRFRETREMAQALRDAIYGHRTAFEAGILHRDISEGNVLIANGRGFLHDLDYASNWKAFLYVRRYEHTIESWDKYVKTGAGIPREGAGAAECATAEKAPPVGGIDSGTNKRSPPAPIVNRKGEKEYYVDAVIAERREGRTRKYKVKWEGVDEDQATWEPAANVRGCAAFLDWMKRPEDERRELSKKHLPKDTSGTGEEAVSATSKNETGAAPVRAERNRTECKERTGTFYFMAIEVLRGPVIHQVKHDLESFFWLLIWLVLRHTAHTHSDTALTLKTLFDQPTDGQCSFSKAGWLLTGDSIGVEGNAPLTYILEKFTKLCRVSHYKDIFMPLTYDSVLKIFDDALDREDWPVDDAAIPFVPARNPDLRHQARPQGSIPGGQLSGQGQNHTSARAGSSKLPLPLGIVNLQRDQDVASGGTRSIDGAMNLLRSRMGSSSGTFEDAVRTASGSVPVSGRGLSYVEGPPRRSRHSSLRDTDIVMPPPLPDSPTPSMPRRSTASSISEIPSSPAVQEQPESPEPWDTHSGSPSIASRLQAALEEPDSGPDSPPHIGHGLDSSHTREYERVSSPSGVSHNGRKRSYEDLGRNEEELGPSKRSRTRSQQSRRQLFRSRPS
ncbi:uncharacterized protein B0H18DRAFT_1215351 [Fomitopsis serialis]|uniref:uncharacterized protein n=1 Tax=Fomitopsis serialis TaxID=139415 RepID=UPI002008ADCD|nr:uncharacterized protein B0H18DRAFT_1215351 [Neoantrodia serialis]KAH9915741.1 hypothetical protein B0H18DRAFT_1215351 [Neoantrodia serialis]